MAESNEVEVKLAASEVRARKTSVKDANGNPVKDEDGKVIMEEMKTPDGRTLYEAHSHISNDKIARFNIDVMEAVSWDKDGNPSQYNCTMDKSRWATISTGVKEADGTVTWTEDKEHRIPVAEAVKEIEENKAEFKDAKKEEYKEAKAAEREAKNDKYAKMQAEADARAEANKRVAMASDVSAKADANAAKQADTEKDDSSEFCG